MVTVVSLVLPVSGDFPELLVPALESQVAGPTVQLQVADPALEPQVAVTALKPQVSVSAVELQFAVGQVCSMLSSWSWLATQWGNWFLASRNISTHLGERP